MGQDHPVEFRMGCNLDKLIRCYPGHHIVKGVSGVVLWKSYFDHLLSRIYVLIMREQEYNQVAKHCTIKA